MKYQKLINRLSVGIVVLMVAACEAPPPYVLNAGEFNRDSGAFKNGVTNREEVKVCYAKDGTTARAVTEMAQQECALYSKKAVFRTQSYQDCPLVTPIAAVYDCVGNGTRDGFYRTTN
ncbi:MAG: hypothetical protein HQ483_14440 [Rhodospirillales bacterium]|nr:hypothetical protein [Rhodospirillales bacterium]